MRREDLFPASLPVFSIPIDQVDIPDNRLRSLKPLQASAIGAAIKADRQYDAISVTRLPGQTVYTLVDGLHRLVGMRQQGFPHIDARIVGSALDARRRQEIASAWARADDDAFDRSAQIAALAEIAQAEDEVQSIALGLNWDETTADALGVSRRTVFNYLKLHRFYTGDQKALLRERGMADERVPLIKLAALPPEDFDRAFDLIARTNVGSIAEALAFIAPAPVNAWDKQKAKVLTAAAKWQPHELRELIDELRALYRTVTASEGEGND